MKTVLMTKGLPASGKSTFAKQLVADNPGVWTRVNKDDLRAMLHNSHWSRGNEKMVLHVRDMIIVEALERGQSVVVDDTNFAPQHAVRLEQLAREHGANFVVREFTDVPLDECIRRDLARPNSVGETVIRRMYNQYLRPPAGSYPVDPNLPWAIICDLDGTLFRMVGRGPYEWMRVGEDEVVEAVAHVVNTYFNTDSGVAVILMSGRDSVCRDLTEDALTRGNIGYDLLYMRAENDNRKDSIVKRELFETHIRGRYNVRFILDDRDQVVQMWRDLGLTVFQVAEGDF